MYRHATIVFESAGLAFGNFTFLLPPVHVKTAPSGQGASRTPTIRDSIADPLLELTQ